MSTFSVVVLIGGSGSNLQAIIDWAKQTNQFTVNHVISHNPDVFGIQRAEKANIPVTVVNHREYDTRYAFELALQKVIDEAQADLVVLAGFMRILSGDFVRLYQHKMLNIHPSLLPHYKGLNTHARVLDAAESWHGTSVHYVTPELDDGPIIAQVKFAIQADDSANDLKAKVQRAEHWIYPTVIGWIAENRLKQKENNVLLDGEALGPLGRQFSFQEIEGTPT